MLRVVLCLSCLLWVTAHADLSIYGTLSDGLGGGIERQAIYLKADQMRIDRLASTWREGEKEDGVDSSILIRFSGHPSGMLFINHETKRIQMLSSLRERGATQASISASDDPANPVRVEIRDETREILGHTARRCDFAFAGNVDPLVLLGQQLPAGMAGLVSIKLQISGSSWVVPGMTGAGELAGFFAQLARRQLTIGMLGPVPADAAQELSLLSPGLSNALTDVLAQITRQGFPLLIQAQSDMEVDMEGFMADMVRGMLEAMGIPGHQSIESAVTGVDNDVVAAELFYDGGLPKGYSLNTPQ